MSSTAAPEFSGRKAEHANSRAPEYGNNRAPEYGASPQVTETATEARQGVTGHGVSMVLVISTVSVIVAFIILYAVFFAR